MFQIIREAKHAKMALQGHFVMLFGLTKAMELNGAVGFVQADEGTAIIVQLPLGRIVRVARDKVCPTAHPSNAWVCVKGNDRVCLNKFRVCVCATSNFQKQQAKR